MNIELENYQIDALSRMRNGTILNAAVGLGKSRVGLTYYFNKVVEGNIQINGEGKFKEPKYTTPLYIITTAKKRDTNDWEYEMLPFLLSTDPENSIRNIKVKVDSWNNIKKYASVKDSFFIFDEDRVTGGGVWANTFIKIARSNKWIILSATPGDNYLSYRSVFIAEGWYKNKTDFNNQHVIWQNCGTFWKESTKRFYNEKKLEKQKNAILIPMEHEREREVHKQTIKTLYDSVLYKKIFKNRWNYEENKPVENVSKLCVLLRKVSNSDISRINSVKEIIKLYDRCIIFYNFDYELIILRNIAKELNIEFAECNGHNHQEIPHSKQWLYFCQYNSASEGWNCISTNVIIFYSLNYSYAMMTQAAGRIDRMNTTYKHLYYYYFTSNSPIDLGIMRALKSKKKFNERRFVGDI